MVEATVFLSDAELKLLKKSSNLTAVIKNLEFDITLLGARKPETIKLFIRHTPKGT
jgi:hypothetical protein